MGCTASRPPPEPIVVESATTTDPLASIIVVSFLILGFLFAVLFTAAFVH